MSSSLNIHEVFDGFISGLKEVVGINFAAVAMIEESTVSISAVLTEVENIWNVGDILPLKGTATELVVSQKKICTSLIWLSTGYSSRGKISAARPALGRLSSFDRKKRGYRQFDSGKPGPAAYSREQIDLLERLTAQIATSIDNAQLYARAEHRARVDELTAFLTAAISTRYCYVKFNVIPVWQFFLGRVYRYRPL